MDETQFPARTAGDLTLPDGTKVWVRTLNALQRQEVETEANWHAQAKCRPFCKGGSRYAELIAQVQALSAEQQAVYLAGQGLYMGRLQQEGWELYPDPSKPQRGEWEEEAYLASCIRWEQACAQAAERRKKHEESRFVEEKQAALALAPEERVERCAGAYVSREFAAHFVARSTLETLLRAVRRPDEHTRFAFTGAQEVEDAEDGVREALVTFYRDLDSVSPQSVPS